MFGFGKLIQEKRKEQNLTKKALARLAGCTDTAIGHWETGKRKPSLEMADKILKALGESMTIGTERRTK